MTSSSSLLPTASMTRLAIATHVGRSATAAKQLFEDDNALIALDKIASMVLGCFSSGGKLLLIGNGGSAADAQHIAAEFVGRYKRVREGLPAIALTTDTSALTAISNDFDFETVFSRQVLALGRRHDMLWAISTSGSSPNIVRAMFAAHQCQMAVAGFSGSHPGGNFVKNCHALYTAKSRDTAVVQQLHMIGAHAICDAVEQELAQ